MRITNRYIILIFQFFLIACEAQIKENYGFYHKTVSCEINCMIDVASDSTINLNNDSTIFIADDMPKSMEDVANIKDFMMEDIADLGGVIIENLCGNGIVNDNEQCDDNNQDNTDACTNQCNYAKCGDGFIQKDVEACDDGDTLNDNDCSSTCQLHPCGINCPNIDFILIKSGFFNMGSNNMYEYPIHQVQIKNDFYVGKTEITVGQYRKCVESGVCTRPSACDSVGNPNWTDFMIEKEDHPINCVTWSQSRTFAKWIGGDLLSEAQWEYVATAQGQEITYPWGNNDPTCLLANYSTCLNGRTAPVCSMMLGNTIQGVCDMAGNVDEWVLDEYLMYQDGLIDEQARCSDVGICNTNLSEQRVLRGGFHGGNPSYSLRSAYRTNSNPGDHNDWFGFRVSRILK